MTAVLREITQAELDAMRRLHRACAEYMEAEQELVRIIEREHRRALARQRLRLIQGIRAPARRYGS
jgi:hypothetical protein